MSIQIYVHKFHSTKHLYYYDTSNKHTLRYIQQTYITIHQTNIHYDKLNMHTLVTLPYIKNTYITIATLNMHISWAFNTTRVNAFEFMNKNEYLIYI